MALSRNIGFTALALGLLVPTLASAQALPWQNGGHAAAPTAPAMAAPPAAYPPHSYPAQDYHGTRPMTAPQAAYNPNQRKDDDRQLNLLAAKFYAISSKDPKAISKLKSLQGKVHTFRKSLASDDIAQDAKKLEGRISAQRKSLEAKEAAAMPATQPTPAPQAQISAPVMDNSRITPTGAAPETAPRPPAVSHADGTPMAPATSPSAR